VSPNAHVAVHFSSRSFSPYIALIFLLSQLVTFSPDAALRNDGVVEVVAMADEDMVGSCVAVVAAVESEVLLQATSPIRKGRSRSAFFTFPFCQENDFLY
jgi:hypothetical protein